MALHSPNILALGAGGCGIELGIKLVLPEARIVGYVEREAFAAANLAAKIEEGVLDEAPIWADVADFDGAAYRGLVDIVSIGLPCQPFSVAGKQEGIKDHRWLWPQVWDILRAVRPRYLFMEEVRGFVQSGFPVILGDLARDGWSAEWDLFSAEAVGAPHQRERFFLLADSNGEGLDGEGLHLSGWGSREAVSDSSGTGEAVGDAQGNGTRSRGVPGGTGASFTSVAGSGPDMAESSRAELPQRQGIGQDHGQECETPPGGGQPMADASQQPEREQNNKTRADPRQESRTSFGGGSGELADSGGRGCDQGDGGSHAGEPDPEGSGEELGDARHSARGPEQGSEREVSSRVSGESGEDMADAEVCCGQNGPTARERQRRSSGGKFELADPECPDLREQSGRGGRASRAEEAQPQVCQPFPPGPGDVEAWRQILFHAEELSPALRDVAGEVQRALRFLRPSRDEVAALRELNRGAGLQVLPSSLRGILSQLVEEVEFLRNAYDEAEPAFRRVAHVLARRVDRLRLCGNGVLPIVAGAALVVLGERLEGR